MNSLELLAMSIPPDFECCHVGYALNPKKLRKSDDCVVSYSVPTSSATCKPKLDRWSGGGLADILHVHDGSGQAVNNEITFIAWDWEIPLEEQVLDFHCYLLLDNPINLDLCIYHAIFVIPSATFRCLHPQTDRRPRQT